MMRAVTSATAGCVTSDSRPMPSTARTPALVPMNALTSKPMVLPRDVLPDVRDGLTAKERVVLYVLHEAQRERGDRNVPTAMLWGRVCEHFYISPEELSEMLARLGARRY